MLDNPFLPGKDALLRGFAHLSEAERRMVVEGEFASFAGAV
jgi:hypothetical protein